MNFQEKASGIKAGRPELEKMMGQLRKGDVVCIYKLDRLGRSLKKLLELIAEFEKRGVRLRSLMDSIDTTTPQGRLILNIFASLAEFDRIGQPKGPDSGANQDGIGSRLRQRSKGRATQGTFGGSSKESPVGQDVL